MKTKTARFVMVTMFLLIATGFSIPPGQITSAATSAAFPLGTYATELTRGDVPASLPPVFVTILVGRWEMTFLETGRFTVTKDRGPVVVDSQYVATQNQIAVFNDKGPLACDIQERDPRFPSPPPAQKYSGAYNWTFDGKMMTYTKIADECRGRAVAFAAHPCTKRE